MTKRLIEIDNLSFIVEYDYSPGTPDRLYLPNGDPGYPGDPEELALYSVWHFDADLFEYLSGATLHRIEEKILEIEREPRHD